MANIPPPAATAAGALLNLLGSFWSEIYQDDGQLATILDGISLFQWQAAINMDETRRSTDWSEMPIWHREQWYRLVLRDGQQLSRGIPYLYGREIRFGPNDGIEHTFGEYRVSFTSYAIPDSLVRAACAVDQLREASAWLTYGIDFFIDPDTKLIYFLVDPLADERFQKEEVTVDGELIRQTVVWLHQVDIDKQILQTNLGSAMQFWAKSSPRYKELLTALSAAYAGGGTKALLQRIIAAITGAAFALTTETVVSVVQETRQILVLTDQHVYSAPAETEAVVAAGDALTPGDPIFDIAKLVTFRHGTVPDWLTSLTLGKDFLAPSIPGPLVFLNESVPLTLEGQVVRFDIGGDAASVAAFWASVDEFGETSGVTLGERLDSRGPGHLPLYPGFLPQTINPLEFLIQNMFRENIWLLQLKQTADSNWLPVYWSQLLRELTPPHTSVLVVAELGTLTSSGLPGVDDIIDWDLQADALEDESLLGIDELLNPTPLLRR